jgi:alpha-maltose-1-phosphate synthase
MQILVLTNEYPPNIYGGAGVHVHHLTEELLSLENEKPALEILCFGDQKESGQNKDLLGIESPLIRPLDHCGTKNCWIRSTAICS